MKPELLVAATMFNSATCNMPNLETVTVMQLDRGAWTYVVSANWQPECPWDTTTAKCAAMDLTPGETIYVGDFNLGIYSLPKDGSIPSVTGAITYEWNNIDKPLGIASLNWTVCAHLIGNNAGSICQDVRCYGDEPANYDVRLTFDSATQRWTYVSPCGSLAQ